MADPLDALRLPIVPIEPRPAFAAALWRRLQGLEPREPARSSFTPTVRYFVEDLEAAVGFYRDQLEFEVEVHRPPGFAMLYHGDLRLLLNTPTGGSHGLPDGSLPEPGGWNRISLQVADLQSTVETIRGRGGRFRTGIVAGAAVRHALLEDPSGNFVELFEPLPGYHERARPSADT